MSSSVNGGKSPAPAEPVPAEPVPAEPVPAEPVPAEPVPAEPVPASVEEVLALVRAGGGRATASRRVLLEVLFGSSDHRSVEDLAAAVQSRAPDVHLSTIYRNLEELERLGVIVHTHLGHGPATYQLASSAHSHLICERCGRRFEAPEEFFAGLAREALERYGFTIDPHHFAILGRCADCGAESPPNVTGDEG